MMKRVLFSLFLLINICNIVVAANPVIWNIDNLSAIGGYNITVYGNPKIISTDKGNALEFNAGAVTAPATNTGDRIQIKGNPLGTSNSEFTIEMIFKPYTTTTDFAPRIFHICRTDSMSGPRVMTMEIRSTNTWTTDLYNKSVTGTGMMGTTHYPTDQWMHLAMTYKNNVMTGYVNGVLDVTQSGNAYTGLPATAEVSLGGRMNNVNYFKGAIRKLIFTPLALNPSQFTMDIATNLKPLNRTNYHLEQNYPNPVTNSSVIAYTLACRENVCIEVFNSMGLKVQTLINSVADEGKQQLVFTKGNLPAGIYFYTITTASGFKETNTMTLK
jgi:hypothetical protein